MNELKRKSEFNIEAAKILVDKNYYASSVHCSYYSSIQLAKHVLTNKLGISFASLKSKYTKPIGTHNIIREAIVDEIKVRLHDKFKSGQFNTKFGLMKKLREEADYEEVEIDSSKASASTSYSLFINEILKEL